MRSTLANSRNVFEEVPCSESKIFLFSDSHYHHSQIIGYCKRPFSNVEEMNDEITSRYNETVKEHDVVYFLGDFAMGPRSWSPREQFEKYKIILDQLPGKKTLIKGNHDHLRAKDYLEMGFVDVQHSLTFDKSKIAMIHDPSKVRFLGKDTYRFFAGHVHESWLFTINAHRRILNASVELHDYKPIEIKAALCLMQKEFDKLQNLSLFCSKHQTES